MATQFHSLQTLKKKNLCFPRPVEVALKIVFQYDILSLIKDMGYFLLFKLSILYYFFMKIIFMFLYVNEISVVYMKLLL